MTQRYHSNGKLLLTGEYAVLDGALSLAIPTIFGQTLNVEAIAEPGLYWTSYTVDDEIWYEGVFSFDGNGFQAKNFDSTSNTLLSILQKAKGLNPEFPGMYPGLRVRTRLEFPNDWGLGSSSTLINNIAQWARVDAFRLLKDSFGGSGYDIAAAQHDLPIFFQNIKGIPSVKEVELPWNFTDRLFFVHLNRKQNSKLGIERYRAKQAIDQDCIEKIGKLTSAVITCTSLEALIKLLEEHEQIISSLIGLPTRKEILFPDFNGLVKSLGAWGGDFVLVSGAREEMAYFEKKGFRTIVPYTEMIK